MKEIFVTFIVLTCFIATAQFGMRNPAGINRLPAAGGGGGGGYAEENIAGLHAFWNDSTLSVGDGNPVGTWTDTKYGNNATSSGTARPTFRATGGPSSTTAVEFDGSNDDMVTGGNITLSSADKFAVSFWLYQNSYGTGNQPALETGAVQYDNDGSFRINPNSGDFSEFEYDYIKDVGRNRVTTARPPAAEWVHYAINFDAAGDGSNGEIKNVWTNGVAATLNNCCGFDNAVTPRDSVLHFMSRAGSSLFNAGKLHHVAIYTNTALTGTDAANLHNTP